MSVEIEEATPAMSRTIAAQALLRAANLIDNEDVEHAALEIAMAFSFLPDLRYGREQP